MALMTQAQTDYLKQDRHTNIHFARILEAIKKWQTLNDDIASAWHLVLAALEREPKAQQQQQSRSAYQPVVRFGADPSIAQQREEGSSGMRQVFSFGRKLA